MSQYLLVSFVVFLVLHFSSTFVSADFSDGTIVQVWSCRPNYVGQQWVYHPQNSLNIRLLVRLNTFLLFFTKRTAAVELQRFVCQLTGVIPTFCFRSMENA
jgi:hypothetical protein